MDIIVTTSQRCTEKLIDKAKSVSKELSAKFISRKKIINLENKNEIYLVVSKNGLVCHHQGQKLFFHPSMAMLRMKRIMKGEEDIFTTLCGNMEGKKVLDCTLGFGSDSLIFSYLTGTKGKVVSLEKSKIIHSIVNDGFKGNYPNWEEINPYIARIETFNRDYNDFLFSCSDKAFDIVYFDPMFDSPLEKSVHLNPLRSFAEDTPLSYESVEQGKRVAREKVIIKNSIGFNFSNFGVTKIFKKNASKVQYGVIDLKK